MRGPRRWAALSLGGTFAAGVCADGMAHTWGANDAGQLGCPPGPGRAEPGRLAVLKGWRVRAVAAGHAHGAALTPGDVITWGANDEGQCGQGERAERGWVKPRSLKPLQVRGGRGGGACWGGGGGWAGLDARTLPPRSPPHTRPRLHPPPHPSQGLHVSQVVCGAHHTLVVTATAAVFAWGRNDRGQLGLGDTAVRRAPAPVAGLWALPVVALAAGDAHSAALTSAGALFTWGDAQAGALGHGQPGGVRGGGPAGGGGEPSPRAAAAAAPPRRAVNQRFLSALEAMGIPSERAELALAETGNVGVEASSGVEGRVEERGGKVAAGGVAAQLPLPTSHTPFSSHRLQLSGCFRCRTTRWSGAWPAATPARLQRRTREPMVRPCLPTACHLPAASPWRACGRSLAAPAIPWPLPTAGRSLGATTWAAR